MVSPGERPYVMIGRRPLSPLPGQLAVEGAVEL